MRTKLCIAFIFIFTTVVYGQNISNMTVDSDTSFWLNRQDFLLKRLKKIKPFETKQNYHFRLFYHGQLISNSIDLWQDEDSTLSIEAVFYTNEIVPSGELPTNRLYSEKVSFESSKAIEALKIIRKNKIEYIPTDKQIKGWSKGFDGVEFIIETLRDKNYSFKQYWTPSAQDSIFEAHVLKNFTNELWTLLNINRLENEFKARIPFECYNSGGPTTACRILTRKEKRHYKQERKNYR